jgi:hypothetical protein
MGTINYDLDPETTDLIPVAWLMDLDNSGVLFDDFSGDFIEIPSYGNHGLVSQSQITIDDNNHIYVVFAHMNENQFLGAFCRHLWATKSTDGGDTWSDFTELTTGEDFDVRECVYPAMAKNANEYLHLTFQADYGPGNALQDETHPQQQNDILYMKVLKSDIGIINSINEYNTINSISIYPNPANDYVNVNIISPVSTNAIISISNILGQQVYSESINVKAGNTNIHIDVNNLPAGMYMFSLLADGNLLKTQKIIIE